ncbi:hypothetical protein [Alicyclobacillus suci]|nr:hypothetical protein [Alicyclobacillus suci]
MYVFQHGMLQASVEWQRKSGSITVEQWISTQQFPYQVERFADL